MRQLEIVICGAGPAGLTAALELVRRTDHSVRVVEALGDVGGLARTIVHRGNRMDIGGHRFFSKSAWVMDWWRDILPLSEEMNSLEFGVDPLLNLDLADRVARETAEESWLLRPRLSRILYRKKFFSYPIRPTLDTLQKLGFWYTLAILGSYGVARMRPIRPERNLADFFTNRFGRVLYETFFRDYTEKVWGVPCEQIDPSWGAQRIKSLSIMKLLRHAALKRFRQREGVEQRNTETSLIERFLYPKHGPGQLWQKVAKEFVARGGRLYLNAKVERVDLARGKVKSVTWTDSKGEQYALEADIVVSSMPIRDLISMLQPGVPRNIREIAEGLAYRDFITIGVLVESLEPSGMERHGVPGHLLPDNWIYVQEPDVHLGRIQFFNNWSPGLVREQGKIWMGLEYFANEGDDLWRCSDGELAELAARELESIGLVRKGAVLDTKVVRVPKAYPAYFGTYSRFGDLRRYLDSIEGLYVIGRNGMHRYNNQDHAMLSAKRFVDGLVAGQVDREAVWETNTDQAYQETMESKDK